MNILKTTILGLGMLLFSTSCLFETGSSRRSSTAAPAATDDTAAYDTCTSGIATLIQTAAKASKTTYTLTPSTLDEITSDVDDYIVSKTQNKDESDRATYCTTNKTAIKNAVLATYKPGSQTTTPTNSCIDTVINNITTSPSCQAAAITEEVVTTNVNNYINDHRGAQAAEDYCASATDVVTADVTNFSCPTSNTQTGSYVTTCGTNELLAKCSRNVPFTTCNTFAQMSTCSTPSDTAYCFYKSSTVVPYCGSTTPYCVSTSGNVVSNTKIVCLDGASATSETAGCSPTGKVYCSSTPTTIGTPNPYCASANINPFCN